MTTATGHTNAILASRVCGTSVLDVSGDAIGEVQDVVLDKTSNNIMFAVVNFGGALVTGGKYFAVPWKLLDYDPGKSAYVLSRNAVELHGAPADTIDELTADDGLPYRERAFQHYGIPQYW